MSVSDESPEGPADSSPASHAAPAEAQDEAQDEAVDQWSPDLPMPLDPGPVQRALRFRGGPFDGATWRGEIAVGARLACGPGPWTPESIYVVTDDMVSSLAGETEFVAVPGEG